MESNCCTCNDQSFLGIHWRYKSFLTLQSPKQTVFWLWYWAEFKVFVFFLLSFIFGYYEYCNPVMFPGIKGHQLADNQKLAYLFSPIMIWPGPRWLWMVFSIYSHWDFKNCGCFCYCHGDFKSETTTVWSRNRQQAKASAYQCLVGHHFHIWYELQSQWRLSIKMIYRLEQA